MIFITLIYLAALVASISAKTHTYYFNTTYVTANPDGTHERRVVGINNEWPIPTIKVKKNDRVVIHLTNLLDENTSLHFHGLFQKGTSAMDGAQDVTQCPIAPGQTFTYNFTVEDQAGTYWYHSHSGAQYSDGLRGFFIIEDELPFEYDEEVLLSISDWYHKDSKSIMQKFLNRYNPTGSEPIPQNSLFNDTKNATWSVEPSKTYLLRIVNMGIFTSQYLFLEGHTFTIVEVDGVLVEPKESDSLYITVAQRYSVLVKTKGTADKNYRFVNVIDYEMLDSVPDDLQIVSTSYVSYSKENDNPKTLDTPYIELIESLSFVDDYELVTLSKEPLYAEADYQIALTFNMDNLGDGVNYAFFNEQTYVPPKVPTLMSVMSSGDFASNVKIYGSNTNSFILQENEIIELVLNNNDAGKHPFHLHGHNFQLISRSAEGEEEDPIFYDPDTNHTDYPEYPMMRDTVMVRPFGHLILRFKADNPGVWFFHCHVDWHLEQGLAITLIEAPFEIQKQKIPQDHFDACNVLNISTVGNAAGKFGEKETDWLDLEGEPLQVPPLPEGFTLKGYIAMAICTFIALYGLNTIYRYGMEDITTDESEHIVQKLYSLLDSHSTLDARAESMALSANINQEINQ